MATKRLDPARAPLFERLVDFDPLTPYETKPLRTLTKKELKASVRREVEWLLNTRSPLPAYRLEREELSALNYGIPNFETLFYPQDAEYIRRLGQLLSRVISAFEPRLRNIHVTLDRYDPIKRTLWINIEAHLVVGSTVEPMSFLVKLQNNLQGISEVYERE